MGRARLTKLMWSSAFCLHINPIKGIYLKTKHKNEKIHDNLANAETTRGMSRTKYYIDVSLPAESPAPPPKIGPFLLSS